MNQQQKIQRLIDYCGELEAEVCEARRWALHYRRTCKAYGSEIDGQYDTIWEKEVENAELRAGLVFYAVENAKLIGTMRDADTPGTTTASAARNEHLECYPFCECGACKALRNGTAPPPTIYRCGECGSQFYYDVFDGKWQCPECGR